MVNPTSAWGPSRRETAAPFDLLVAVGEVFPGAVEGAAEGVKTEPGLEMHELAAALAVEPLEGVLAFLVPLPPKLQACTFLELAS